MVLKKSLVAVAIFAFSASFPSSAISGSINLVLNGNFESGNSGFTSEYSYAPAGNGYEGEYTIRSNPYPWNGAFVSIGDHTSGSGLMMVANGSPESGQIVWQSAPIIVAAATSYFFEAFVNNVCCHDFSYGPGSQSILEFSIEQTAEPPVLTTISTNLDLAGTWEGLSTQFTPTSAGSVVLRLINRNTQAGGNDFAVDDIYFGLESTVNPTAPEPSSLALLTVGSLGLAAAARRRRKA